MLKEANVEKKEESKMKRRLLPRTWSRLASKKDLNTKEKEEEEEKEEEKVDVLRVVLD